MWAWSCISVPFLTSYFVKWCTHYYSWTYLGMHKQRLYCLLIDIHNEPWLAILVHCWATASIQFECVAWWQSLFPLYFFLHLLHCEWSICFYSVCKLPFWMGIFENTRSQKFVWISEESLYRISDMHAIERWCSGKHEWVWTIFGNSTMRYYTASFFLFALHPVEDMYKSLQNTEYRPTVIMSNTDCSICFVHCIATKLML